VRDGPGASRAFRERIPVSVASRATKPMRWARTGAHLTGQAWLEDYLSGVLWYLGILVLLGVLAYAVQVIAGS